jgi:hypothetical protein
MARIPARNWSALAVRPGAALAAWLIWSLITLAVAAAGGFVIDGPDNWMRLFEVRDLVAGQAWFDVTQYRIDPPHGASMHWSRLVDLPLAALALLLGETAAAALVPLLWLLPAILALRAIMLRLGFPPLALAIGLVALPLFPLLPDAFMPMRIDHHAPQAVLGLAAVALLLDGSRKAAAFAGVLAAAWVVVSLEGLVPVAGIAAVLGLIYIVDGDRRLGAFLAALALAAPVLSLATRPGSEFTLPYCDVLMPGHMAAFMAAAVIALALPVLPGQAGLRGRLAALLLIPVVAGPVAFAALGPCLGNPFAALDPLLQQYWYGYITEGLPVWRQPVSVAAMLVWTMVLVLAGWWQMRQEGVGEGGRCRDVLAMVAVIACLFSFWLMRAGILAQLLAIPFAAFLLAHWLPRARAVATALPRIGATLACFALATPMLASGATKPLDPLFATATMRAGSLAPVEPGQCDYRRLAAVPAGHVLAPLDAGPQILGQSGHTIVMASYHRNQARMVDVITAFSGRLDEARDAVVRNRADYVVACAAEADFALYRTARTDNLANAMASREVPGWLEPVEGFSEGPLRFYRVVR